MNDIGILIYNRRKELGLTLEEVGNAVGVSKSTVKKWEDGFITNMRRDKIEKLAKTLQISPVRLLGIKTVITPQTAEPSDPKLEKAVSLYCSLNETGKDVAIQRLEELNEINKYRKE